LTEVGGSAVSDVFFSTSVILFSFHRVTLSSVSPGAGTTPPCDPAGLFRSPISPQLEASQEERASTTTEEAASFTLWSDRPPMTIIRIATRFIGINSNGGKKINGHTTV
jgi:hypothetical protein